MSSIQRVTQYRIAFFYWWTVNLAIPSFLQIGKGLTWQSLPPPQITCSKQLLMAILKLADSNPNSPSLKSANKNRYTISAWGQSSKYNNYLPRSAGLRGGGRDVPSWRNQRNQPTKSAESAPISEHIRLTPPHNTHTLSLNFILDTTTFRLLNCF